MIKLSPVLFGQFLFNGLCLFQECPLSYNRKNQNEHAKSIFCNKVGVISAVECSWVNEQKNARKAEVGDYFYRCFIIWFELLGIFHLKNTQLYLNISRIFNCKYKTIIQELNINY